MAECLSWSMRVLQSRTEGEPHTEMQSEICSLLWCTSLQCCQFWVNQAVQSILFMNTDRKLWQEGGEKSANKKNAIEKSHFYILHLYVDYN